MKLRTLFAVGQVVLLFLVPYTVNAQQDEPQQEQEQNSEDLLEEVVVRGYRESLMNSTLAKRSSIGVVDEIFSDDLGKLPSQNLAESLSRIPGVKINREVTGEGQQISVRGLNSTFTKIVINGNSVTVASDGSLGAGQRGRQVDLDIFPPELFRSLSVNKTATADQIEGGVSGYVNMHTLRPSDLGEGSNFRFGVEGAYNEMSGETSPKTSLIYSYNGDNFGVLAGIVDNQHKSRVDGFETVGGYQAGCVAEWRSVTDFGCVPGSTSPDTFHYTYVASADYAAAHPGVNEGDVVDINAVSGLTDTRLDNFALPYIVRPMYTLGDRNSTSSLVALQYNPNDSLELSLDVLHVKADRSFLRNEAMNIYRRNYIQYGLEWLPEDIVLGNGEDGLAIESGTFYNNRVWVGSRQYEENLTYTSIMPGVSWQINDVLQMDVTLSSTDSEFDRDEPYLLYYSPAGTMHFAYDGDFPTVQHSANIERADPGWTFGAGPGRFGNQVQAGSFRFQRASRDTEVNTFHVDFALGEDPNVNGLKFGVAMDDNSSDMTNYTGGNAWDNLVNGSNLDANFASYVVNSPITDLGNDISGYNGLKGIASINWAAVKNELNYSAFVPQPAAGGDYFGQVVGDIDEEIRAFYIEANTESEIVGHVIRTNMGVRYVDTDQKVSSTDSDETHTDYSRVLPSFNAVFDVTEDIKLRGSASKSFTRASPASMFPNASWGSSGIDSVNAGNPFLQPFESINFDIGGEWYFSDLGYVGFTFYQKDITGFTREENIQVQFLELANYGLDISDEGLSATQEDALVACGGRTSPNCVSTITTDVNIDGTTKLYGWELIWVQPLDMLLEGLGFNASMNKIDQDASDEDAEITGVGDSFNFTAYYEYSGFQTRVTYTKTDETETNVGWSPTRSAARDQIDLSASYDLPPVGDVNLTLTFDAYNLTNEPLRDFFESDGNTFNIRYPGATYTIGVRGSY